VAFDRALGRGHDGAQNRGGVRGYKTGDRDPSRLVDILTWQVRKQNARASRRGRNDVWDMQEHKVFDIKEWVEIMNMDSKWACVTLESHARSTKDFLATVTWPRPCTGMLWEGVAATRALRNKEETKTRQGLTLVIKLAGEVCEQWAVN
jgi:hypothetical protein